MNGAPDFGAMPLKDQFMELMADSAQVDFFEINVEKISNFR